MTCCVTYTCRILCGLYTGEDKVASCNSMCAKRHATYKQHNMDPGGVLDQMADNSAHLVQAARQHAALYPTLRSQVKQAVSPDLGQAEKPAPCQTSR